MERVEAEQLFARALDDVWHLVQPAGEKCWLLQCTGCLEQVDDAEQGVHECGPVETDGMQAPIELQLCEACLRRLK